ncbi:hypothetical protein P3T36_003972 [Kitasatospora sp. MAP12-15]|nr:hypothetical protein [Kitasatospora sp. MAP12-44]
MRRVTAEPQAGEDGDDSLREMPVLATATGPVNLERCPPVEALLWSRAWLRRLPRATASGMRDGRPFASPFHWAAFAAWGM